MVEVFKKEDSEIVEALINQWTDLNTKKNEIEREMKSIKDTMFNKLGTYKIGDVVSDVDNDKKYVVSEARVSDYDLQDTIPKIEIRYTVNKIKKDGRPSLNTAYIHGENFEKIGERIDFI